MDLLSVFLCSFKREKNKKIWWQETQEDAEKWRWRCEGKGTVPLNINDPGPFRGPIWCWAQLGSVYTQGLMFRHKWLRDENSLKPHIGRGVLGASYISQQALEWKTSLFNEKGGGNMESYPGWRRRFFMGNKCLVPKNNSWILNVPTLKRLI